MPAYPLEQQIKGLELDLHQLQLQLVQRERELHSATIRASAALEQEIELLHEEFDAKGTDLKGRQQQLSLKFQEIRKKREAIMERETQITAAKEQAQKNCEEWESIRDDPAAKISITRRGRNQQRQDQLIRENERLRENSIRLKSNIESLEVQIISTEGDIGRIGGSIADLEARLSRLSFQIMDKEQEKLDPKDRNVQYLQDKCSSLREKIREKGERINAQLSFRLKQIEEEHQFILDHMLDLNVIDTAVF